MSEIELLESLKKIDTPTITNVVATYPGNDLCLEIYNPWETNWYTDNQLSCWYPDLGPLAGYAVTCVYGVTDPTYSKLTLIDVLEEMEKLRKPSIFCFEQRFPPRIANKVGLAGGNLTSAIQAVGAVGAVSNGPSRDIHEIRPMKFQYLTRGVCPGHGPQSLQAIQIPVSLCGMDVSPGDIIHMDENGAVKFPATRLEEVVRNARLLLEREEKQVTSLRRAKNVEEVRSIMSGHQYVTK